ncbi:hypothetical protein [Litchfieldia alkalitelluris]|uniref:hypothetical protein n=1 Tax=Litchfieldia alkalitelluris TaxID=304268 RepID=UPI000997FF9B|nr:hypothetical protein [Litchfieldia alkalitelluris]
MPDSIAVEQLEKKVHDLTEEIEKTEKELEKLHDIESLYNYQVTEGPYINMYSSKLLYDLQNNDVESLNERSHEEFRFEEKNGEIYAITLGNERKITYNDDNYIIKRWFIEGVSFKQNGNEVEVTIRPHYVDQNGDSVQEDRYFKLYFIKLKEDWYLKDISF